MLEAANSIIQSQQKEISDQQLKIDAQASVIVSKDSQLKKKDLEIKAKQKEIELRESEIEQKNLEIIQLQENLQHSYVTVSVPEQKNLIISRIFLILKMKHSFHLKKKLKQV